MKLSELLDLILSEERVGLSVKMDVFGSIVYIPLIVDSKENLMKRLINDDDPLSTAYNKKVLYVSNGKGMHNYINIII